MIKMTGIRKEYRMGENVVAALDGVDIHIKPHEFVAIIGPSGSGKSTLMNIIGCLDVADEGSYIFDGQEIEAYTEDELAAITIFLKKDTSVDAEWFPKKQQHDITAAKYYGVALTNAAKVVVATYKA